MGGVAVAHHLLKNTIPALRKLDSKKSYHVTIVSPSSHYFWKISAPRIMVKADEDLYNQILRPLDKAFAQYGDAVAQIEGFAISTDATTRTIKVKKNNSTEDTIHYDSLVIATGTTSASPLWSLQGDHSKTLNEFKSTREKLSRAKTVLVSGGGAVGIESCGEVVSAFPGTKVTLISGSDRLLPRLSESLGNSAEQILKKVGVEVLYNVKTTGFEDTSDGQTKVKLSDGSERTVDVYIDGTGGSPNSDWLPPHWLNDQQRVKVDKQSLRVIGSDAERVYAVGDVADYSQQTWMDADASIAPISSSVGSDIVKTLSDGKGVSAGLLSGLFGLIPGLGSPLSPKKFSPLKGVYLVPVGPSNGFGIMLGVSAPAFLVSLIKGKTYFLEMALKQWNGDAR